VKSTPANPWPWLFLAAVVLLIAAVVGLIVLLRRRQGTPEVG
jgi:ABC-type phosphate transport system auxiliary subunit